MMTYNKQASQNASKVYKDLFLESILYLKSYGIKKVWTSTRKNNRGTKAFMWANGYKEIKSKFKSKYLYYIKEF